MRRKERWVIDMDENRIESLVKWWKETDTQGMDIGKHLASDPQCGDEGLHP